jgi:hypothetical protein
MKKVWRIKLNIKNFEKWDLLPMSPSKLRGFTTYTGQFIVEKIYKRLGTSSPPALAGNTVEPMLMDYVEGKEVDFDKYLNNFKIDTLDYPFRDDVDKYLKLIPKFFEQAKAFKEIVADKELHSYQEELFTEVLSVPFRGFSDFVYKKDNKLFMYDLKTKGRMSINHYDKLQQYFYRKSLVETYQLEVECYLFIVTPSKWQLEPIEFTEEFEIEINNGLKSMNRVLELCNEPKDFAYLYTPNLDDFIWRSPHLKEARKDIWGV